MKRAGMLAALAAMMFAPQPGQRKVRGRKRRKPTKRHRAGIKLRCRTLERYREGRAILATPITARSTIRAKANRAALRALGYHVEPNAELDQ